MGFMGRSRRRIWGLLLLIVVAPVVYYAVQALLHPALPNPFHLPTTAAIIPPTAEPRGPTPAVTLAPPIPSPREMDEMAFDTVHNDVVMYGGTGFGSGAQNSVSRNLDVRRWGLASAPPGDEPQH